MCLASCAFTTKKRPNSPIRLALSDSHANREPVLIGLEWLPMASDFQLRVADDQPISAPRFGTTILLDLSLILDGVRKGVKNRSENS